MLSGYSPFSLEKSAVWRSATYTYLKTSGRCNQWCLFFLPGGEFESNIARRRSVAVLSIHYKIGCNPIHPLYGALPDSYVPVRGTHGALVAHSYNYKSPRCRTSQDFHSIFGVNVEQSDKNGASRPGVGLAGLKSKANMPFHWPSYSLHFY